MSNAEYSAQHEPVESGVKQFYPDIIGLPYNDGKAETDDLTDAEKLDYLYRVAVKVGVLVDSITPAQVEQVQKIQRNPLLAKMFSGILSGGN